MGAYIVPDDDAVEELQSTDQYEEGKEYVDELYPLRSAFQVVSPKVEDDVLWSLFVGGF